MKNEFPFINIDQRKTHNLVFDTKLKEKLYRLIHEKYYILPRGPFIPEGSTPYRGDPNNIARLSVRDLVEELAEFTQKRIK